MIRIDLPTNEKTIRNLRVGDEVEIYGTIVTARDAAHKKMVKEWPVFIHDLINEGAIYHCGPIVKSRSGKLETISAGPTTSIREEPYEHLVIEHYGPRIIIGKGGMGPTTLKALKREGAVYIHTTGGAASLIAKKIVKTKEVHLLDELGGPEALWVFEVEGFTGVVTMDSTGHSLHDIVLERSHKNLNRLLGIEHL